MFIAEAAAPSVDCTPTESAESDSGFFQHHFWNWELFWNQESWNHGMKWNGMELCRIEMTCWNYCELNPSCKELK